MTPRALLGAAVTLVRLAIAAVALAAGTMYAYYIMFAIVPRFDDEGYIMVSVRTFLDGLPLYDRTFTQYGPFYYLVMAVFYKVSRLPVGHDATRFVSIAFWIALAVLLGIFVFRVTRSFALGVLVYLQTVLHCIVFIGEPGHPHGLALVLLALMLVCTTIRKAAAVPIALGALAGCVLLIKVNVGVFAAAAAGIALLSLAPLRPIWRAALGLAALGFTVLPFAIMRANLPAWAWPYALVSAGTIGAAGVSVWRLRIADPSARPIATFAWAIGVTLALVTLATLALGTSIHGLLEGVLLAPLRFGGVYTVPWALPRFIVWCAAGSLALAIAVLCIPAASLRHVGAGLKMAFAVAVWWASMRGAFAMVSVLSFVWIVLLPADGTPPAWSRLLPRIFAALLAAGQLLVAYPVAGNQQAWATVFLLPAGAIAMADGVLQLRPFQLAWVRVAAEAALLVGVLYVFRPYYRPRLLAVRYQNFAPLNLPHATRIRIPADEAERYRAIVSALKSHCDQFFSQPGLGSFYFWTEQPPLTGFNATAWMVLFDDRTQQRIIERLAEQRGACVLYSDEMTQAWLGGRSIDDKPLVKYIRQAFHPVETIDDYQILVRNDR